MKPASWHTAKALYELPYMIMQLEKDIDLKCSELRVMRKKLERLKKKESGKNNNVGSYAKMFNM